jgi:hypothetical protein
VIYHWAITPVPHLIIIYVKLIKLKKIHKGYFYQDQDKYKISF